MSPISPFTRESSTSLGRLCFVLMPFKEEYRQVYDFVIRPTVENLGFECVRADDLKKQRNIMRDVVELIDKADLIIADLTDANPNVFYELGISHTLAKTTVMITQSIEQFVPFDLRPYRIVSYTLDIKGAQKLTTQLQEAIRAIDTGTPDYSNPVVDFLPGRKEESENEASRSQTPVKELDARMRQALAAENVRLRLLNGIDVLANAGRASFGPSGGPLIIHTKSGLPEVPRDILAIRGGIETGDDVANAGARLLLEMAQKLRRTGRKSGAIIGMILTQEIFRGAIESMHVNGVPAAQLTAGINHALTVATSSLARLTRRATLEDLLPQKSADCDLVKEAFALVGPRGVVDVELSDSGDESVTALYGDRVNEGYLSQYFITDEGRDEAVLDRPYILLCDETLTSFQPLLPILEQVAKTGKPLLVVARDVKDEALATLVVNRLRGTLKCAAIKAPGYGANRSAKLEDLAIMTDGRVVTADTAIKLENMKLDDLGKAQKVVIAREHSTIIGPAGLQQHYDRLTRGSDVGRVAVISIAGEREGEMRERQTKIKDLVSFLTAAMESGVVAGGGAGCVRLSGTIVSSDLLDRHKLGARVLARSLEEPARQLLKNAGFDEREILAKLRTADSGLVFNVLTGTYEDMLSSGVVDSRSELLLAVTEATSLATLMLTGGLIELREKAKEAADSTESQSHGR